MERMSRMAATLLLAALLAAPTARGEDGPETVTTVGDVAWVSGGIGAESRDRLRALAAGTGFNLKLTFASAGGEYLSDIAVRIVDAAGGTVLTATSEGPLFLVRLPPGRYTVAARNGAREQTQQLSVAAGRLATAVFRWPAD